ncbi:hypothetical protein PPYR_05067 [Photinus pyralis]|uniref:Torsin n=2 Tax=Photinus pyralis TaxID=7054 RepID=A0A5N4AZU3_PHOPY|nr:torsin-1B-like [Photinus pyralis]XP_031334485.1 torsin-1B-like [Photinus pyralis]KAB0802881.1 hypothetical protein PPYR_05067 [Photinus pyralis]
MHVNEFIIFLLIILQCTVIFCFDPFSIGSAAVVGIGSYLYDKTYCKWKECCTDKEIPGNVNQLEALLKSKVYGQHLAEEIIVKALKSHWDERYQPSKALTLSFHGWPGGGKNYVTGFIKEALFTLGGASDHVHHFVSRINFPEESKVAQYQRDLYEWIKSNVTKCPKQLFVFDEVDKAPEYLLNIIKPLIDYNAYVAKVDYRKSIFIFLSNTGESLITDQMIKLHHSGIPRKDIQLQDFENLIIKGAFNEHGGFHHSDTIKSNLIDHYVPFLPLEMEHVRACIIDQFRMRGVNRPSEDDVLSILEFVEWGPSPDNLYSKTGCKRISQKVALIVHTHWR